MSVARRDGDRILLGIVLRLAGVVAFTGLAALVKSVGARGVPVFEIVLFRNAFGLIPLAILVWRSGRGLEVLKTRRPLAHLHRAAAGLIAMCCNFAALQHLQLPENTSIAFAAPLFMTVLSAFMLRESVGAHRWAAVIVGFVGVLIMARPSPGAMEGVGVALALGAAVSAAFSMAAIRQIGATEAGPAIVFYYTLAGVAVGAAGSLAHWATPDPVSLALLVGCGIAGGVGQLLHTESLKRAPLKAVAPFDYSELLWSTLLAWLIWDHLPRPITFIGASIVAASGLYILHREIRAARAASLVSSRPTPDRPAA